MKFKFPRPKIVSSCCHDRKFPVVWLATHGLAALCVCAARTRLHVADVMARRFRKLKKFQ